MRIKDLLEGWDPDDQYWPGRQYPKQQLKPQQYKGKLVARHYGGFTGTTIPPEIRKITDKHVKTASNGTQYVNQYDDAWYARTFKDSSLTWDRFFKQLSPYFSITRTQVV